MQTFPFKPLKVLSQKAIDLPLRHVPTTKSHIHNTDAAWYCNVTAMSYRSRWCCWEGLRLVYLQTLSQQHVTHICHMRGPILCMCDICHQNMSHEFKLIWIHTTSHGIKLHVRTDMSHKATFPRARYIYIYLAVVRICATLQIPSVIESEDREVWSFTQSQY